MIVWSFSNLIDDYSDKWKLLDCRIVKKFVNHFDLSNKNFVNWILKVAIMNERNSMDKDPGSPEIIRDDGQHLLPLTTQANLWPSSPQSSMQNGPSYDTYYTTIQSTSSRRYEQRTNIICDSVIGNLHFKSTNSHILYGNFPSFPQLMQKYNFLLSQSYWCETYHFIVQELKSRTTYTRGRFFFACSNELRKAIWNVYNFCIWLILFLSHIIFTK